MFNGTFYNLAGTDGDIIQRAFKEVGDVNNLVAVI